MRPMGMTAVVLGIAGAFGLGVWSGPALTGAYAGVSAHEPAPIARDVAPAPVFAAPPARATKDARTAPAAAPAFASRVKLARLEITDDVRERMKPLLARGTNLTLASQGFADAEQFAAVAHASRNTGVPFVILKNRVLERKQTLADAIRATAPTVNATVEAERAQAEARSDVAVLQSQWGPI